MAIEFSKPRLLSSFALSCLLGGSALAAPQPQYTPEQVLRLQPLQKEVQIDRPEGSKIAKCTVSAEKIGGGTGYLLRDEGGQLLRKFVDTNGDNNVDQFSYYKDGVEVYRDIDSNFNKKIDQFRWLNTAGTRWGIDIDEDGKIDAWQSISAEEVTAEIVAAIRDRDRPRFERLLLTGKELKTLGIGKAKADLVAKKMEAAGASFGTLAAQQKLVTQETKWVSFGGNQPGLVPAGTEDSTADLFVYENVAAMVETNGKPQAVTIGTLVRVKDAWRLIEAPQITDDSVAEGEPKTTFFAVQRNQPAEQTAGRPSDKAQELMKILEGLGEQQHEEKAAIIEKLANQADTPEMRTLWYRQLADTLSAAVQTNDYTAGIEKLKAIQEKLKENASDSELAAYVQYRWMQAEHGQQLSMPNANFAAIQTSWMADLELFLEAAKKYPDSADAMLELAITQELAGEEEKALKWYDAVVKDFPKSTANRKAAGAKMRLTSIGKPISLRGKLIDNAAFDLAKLKGKVVLIQYWATWCEPCKSDMPLLKELRTKFKGNFEVVGVCLDNNKAEMTAFLKENDPRWPQLFEEGGLDSRFANELGIQTLPTMILVDKAGVVVNRNIRAQELDGELKKLLK